MNSSFAEHLWWEHRLVVPYKGIQDSPDSGFHALDSGFQSPGSRIPPSKFPRFQIGFPCMARSLGFRQIYLLSFSSQRSRTITWEYNQIISTSRWIKKVELYTSMLTCISHDGNDLLYQRHRIQPFNLPYLPHLYSGVKSKCLWERIVQKDFGVQVAWDQAPHWGKRQKTRSNKKNIGERSKPSAIFFSLFPTMRSLIPG